MRLGEGRCGRGGWKVEKDEELDGEELQCRVEGK